MQFCLRGIEIDVALPRSLEEANRRIDKLALMQQRLQEELKQFPPKSLPRKIKGQTIQELTVELQILKRWRRNANIRLEKLLSISCPIDSRELQTEAGLIKHLYLEFRRLNRERVVSIEPESTLAMLLSAAQHWLKNHYSTTLSSAELVKGMMEEDQEHERKQQVRFAEQDREFQQREQNRWQEHILQQQRRDREESEQQQTENRQTEIRRRAKQERQRQQQEQALRMQREQEETQEALNLLSQFAKQAPQ